MPINDMPITRKSRESPHFALRWTPEGTKYLDPLEGKVILRFEIEPFASRHRLTLRPNGSFVFRSIPKGPLSVDVSVDPDSINPGVIGQQGTVNGGSICVKIDRSKIGCITLQEMTEAGQGLRGHVLRIEYVPSYDRKPVFSAK